MGGVVADCGGHITAMFAQTEEDVDAHLNWADGQELQSEVQDGLTLDGALLVVQGEDDLGDVLEPPDRGIGGGRVSSAKKTNSMRGRN